MTKSVARLLLATVIAWVGAGAAEPGGAQAEAARSRAEAPAPPRLDLARVPLAFEQHSGRARFVARGPGYAVYFTPSEAILAVVRSPAPRPSAPGPRRRSPPLLDTVRISLVGANPAAEVVGLDELPGRVNCLLGRDPARWRVGLRTYARIQYRDVYPGIDVFYSGSHGALEYDLVVAPGADPRAIAIAFDDARRVELDARGDLLLHLRGGAVRQPRPVVYQEVAGARRLVEARYTLARRRVGVRVASYDRSRPLVIDPVLLYGTYVGGSALTEGLAIAVDASGVYVAGDTIAPDLPLAGAPLQPRWAGNWDAIVMKLAPDARTLVYATYLGGSGDDSALAIDVDVAGNAYVGGATSSADFPTVAALQPTNHGGYADGFIAKLDPTGSALVYSTFLGGAGDDEILGLKVDGGGSVVVAGLTDSLEFPLVGALQRRNRGGYDAFVARLDAAGSVLLRSTYLGGTGDDYALGIAMDGTGAVYLTGSTSSPDFPTTRRGVQPVYGGGAGDAFVAKLDATLARLVYATYLGGRADDMAYAVAVDGGGAAYVAGWTTSTDFPLASALQAQNHGDHDAFVAKLDPTGTALVYSTYLGGSAHDCALAIGVDSAGNAIVGGYTASSDFPVAASLMGGAGHIWVGRLGSTGALLYATVLGGGGDVWTLSIWAASDGVGYVTGRADLDFPTTPGVVQPLPAGAPGTVNAFLAKLDPLSVLSPGAQTSAARATVTLPILASGRVGATLSYSASGLPPGLSMNPATGVISGTLGSTSGSYSPTVTVSDGASSVATTFAWRVGGVGDQPPVCATATPSVGQIWPPNGKPVAIRVLGLGDPDGDPVTITITGILQDEPTGSEPDGGGIGTSAAWVRAERDRSGNGRVYQIAFTASDGRGGGCEGAVSVGVPADASAGPALNSGVRYDSTVAGARGR